MKSLSSPPVLFELCDISTLRQVVTSSTCTAMDQQYATLAEQGLIANGIGVVGVKYHRNSARVGSRCEARGPSFRRISSAVRQAITTGIHMKIDFSRAQFSLMVALSAWADLHSPCLYELTASPENFDTVVTRLSFWYLRKGKTVTPQRLRLGLHRVMMGSNVPADMMPAPAWIWHYRSEVFRLRHVCTDAFPSI